MAFRLATIIDSSRQIYLSKIIDIRAHHTCKKQGDLTSPSETMREKWRYDFQQLHRHFFWSVFANILLISFIFTNTFMFCICFIIIIDLIFVWFLDFIHFCLEICKDLNVRFYLPIFYVPKITVFKIWQVDCLAFKKLQITQVLLK